MTAELTGPTATGPTAGIDPVDRITLTGLTGFGHHGVLPHERELGQTFVVDVVVELSLAAAARDDDLAATLDYGKLGQAVVADIERDPVDLIETLADRIATTCLGQPLVQGVVVTVHKPQAPMPVGFADVAVTLTRRRITTRPTTTRPTTKQPTTTRPGSVNATA